MLVLKPRTVALSLSLSLAGCGSSDDAPISVADVDADIGTPVDVPVSMDVSPFGDSSAPDVGEADASDVEAAPPRCQRRVAERQPFFGDLHVHTALSLDANLQGTRLRPVDAYRFARGETVGIAPYDAEGKPLRALALDRPLDFVALSDHAEFLGLVTTCLTPGMDGYDSSDCEMYRSDPEVAFFIINGQVSLDQDHSEYAPPCNAANTNCGTAALAAWDEVTREANAANDETDACAFTAFIAYEWSASPGTQNLHRNVIFRGKDVPALPFTYFDGAQEEALWDALDRDCLTAGKGCDALTIPHNSNLSAGLMFETIDGKAKPFSAEYARRRAAMEPLVEIFQHKGSSECLPEMGADERCEFERIPWNTLGSAALAGKADPMKPSDFVRDALAQGLGVLEAVGADPFQYGFVASTDTHLGTPGAVQEETFPGHGGAGAAAQASAPAGLVDKVWFNPGGLAVLWAEENTRDALFDAMRRREAYGTSGPRIVLRFFGGPDVPKDLCDREDFAVQGYASGASMGGVIEPAASPAVTKAPSFAIRAAMDPGTAAHPGATLDRVQIIKGWYAGGVPHYQVIDVAGRTGAVPDDLVDVASCATKPGGTAELCAVWTDPAFDPAVPAFYYARVLEDPTCRWQTRVCRDAQIDCAAPDSVPKPYAGCCAGAPAVQQERAWSSPIFYRVPPPTP